MERRRRVPYREDWSNIYTQGALLQRAPQNGIAPNDHNGYHARVTSNPTPIQGDYAYKERVDDSYDCWQERTELSQTRDDSKQFRAGRRELASRWPSGLVPTSTQTAIASGARHGIPAQAHAFKRAPR